MAHELMTRIFSKESFATVREKSGFDQLEPRQRVIVGIGSAFLLFLLLLQLVVFPYLKAHHRLSRSITAKKAELVKITDLQRQYRLLQKRNGSGNRIGQDKDFSLFSFIEEQAVRSDVKKQILSMRPSTIETKGTLRESFVEINLQKVPLERLVTFLKLIENPGKMVFIRSISIQDSTEDNLVDVIMQIATAAK